MPSMAGQVAELRNQVAQSAQTPTTGPRFEAMWREEVIVPLGRVTFLIEEEGNLPIGAMRRLNQALRAILDVLGALPKDTPDWYRVQLLGRMVAYLSDLVGTRGNAKSTTEELLKDMRNWRYRAVELEPLIHHAPGNQEGGQSPADSWHELVVLPLGRAQVRLEQSPAEALQGYLHAVEGITLTLQVTPKDDPVRLRMASLLVAVQGMLDVLEETTGMGNPDARARAIETFQAAEALGARLAGKPLTASSDPAKAGGEGAETKETVEEQFTWERRGGHTIDYENLERP
jgi:hypothetical protein